MAHILYIRRVVCGMHGCSFDFNPNEGITCNRCVNILDNYTEQMLFLYFVEYSRENGLIQISIQLINSKKS